MNQFVWAAGLVLALSGAAVVQAAGLDDVPSMGGKLRGDGSLDDNSRSAGGRSESRRVERAERAARPTKVEKVERSEKAEKAEKIEKAERPEKREKPERPEKTERRGRG